MGQNKKQGFTLVEILVVVALIAILATITFIAINPARNFRDTRNTQRSSHVTQILNAVTQFTSEEGNTLANLDTTDSAGTVAIPTCPALAIIGDNDTPNEPTGADIKVDLADDLVDDYIVGIPVDPQTGDDADTGYRICQTTGGRVEITAPDTEPAGDPDISVSR